MGSRFVSVGYGEPGFTSSSGVVGSNGFYYTYFATGVAAPLSLSAAPLLLPSWGTSQSAVQDITGYSFSFGLSAIIGAQLNIGLQNWYGGLSGHNSSEALVGAGFNLSLTYMTLKEGPYWRLDGLDKLPSFLSLLSPTNPLANNPDYVFVDLNALVRNQIPVEIAKNGIAISNGPISNVPGISLTYPLTRLLVRGPPLLPGRPIIERIFLAGP